MHLGREAKVHLLFIVTLTPKRTTDRFGFNFPILSQWHQHLSMHGEFHRP